MHHHFEVRLGVSESINRRDCRNDQAVLTFQQRLGRGQAHLLYVIINLGVFLDKGIGRRDIGLGLIIVIVRDKILDGVVREKLFEFAIELGSQCFVVRHDNGGTLQGLHHVGHGERFARTGHTQ